MTIDIPPDSVIVENWHKGPKKSKITSKEEFILEYLQGADRFYNILWYKTHTIDFENPIEVIIEIGDPYVAYAYSFKYLKEPNNKLRTLSCKDSKTAFYYARYVDQKPSKEVEEAVVGDPIYEEFYKSFKQNFEAGEDA